MKAAKSHLRRNGFNILDDGRFHRGYDFAAEKEGRTTLVEVKGRTPGHGRFVLFSYQESQDLKERRNFRVALVLINPKTYRAELVRILSKKDFSRSQKVAHPPVRWYLRNPDIGKGIGR